MKPGQAAVTFTLWTCALLIISAWRGAIYLSEEFRLLGTGDLEMLAFFAAAAAAGIL